MKVFRDFWVLFFAGGILLAGCSNSAASQGADLSSTTQQADAPAASTSLSAMDSSQQGVRYYALSDVAAHKTPGDCWLAIHGKVYDVSGFDKVHPGGQAVYQGCGTDATDLFETRPMGSGTPHSEKARNLMGRFYIGDLKL